MKESKTITPGYKEINDAVFEAGLDWEMQKKLKQKGVYPSLAKILVYNYGMTAKELEKRIDYYVDQSKTDAKDNVSSRVYRSYLQERTPEEYKKNEGMRDYTLQLANDDSNEAKQHIGRHFNKSNFTVMDTAFLLTHGNRDEFFFTNDVEFALQFYYDNREEIESKFKGLGELEIKNELKNLGSFSSFSSENLNKAQLYVKTMAHEIAKEAGQKTKGRSTDSKITNKYSKTNTKSAPNKKKVKEAELEVA